MYTVGNLLEQKTTHEVCTIGPEATVFEAVRVLAEHNLGALIVTEQGRLVGVFTERDYARNIVLKGRSSKDTYVRDVMSSKVIFVTPESTLEECMSLMINKFIRHLPVLGTVGGSRILVGVVSMGDAVKSVLGEREFTIDQLVQYITDSPIAMDEHRLRRAEPMPFS